MIFITIKNGIGTDRIRYCYKKINFIKKIDLNYAEKQSKKDVSCKDENTYFATEDKKINIAKINPKIEIPYVNFM
jgi:hypothetical protein